MDPDVIFKSSDSIKAILSACCKDTHSLIRELFHDMEKTTFSADQRKSIVDKLIKQIQNKEKINFIITNIANDILMCYVTEHDSHPHVVYITNEINYSLTILLNRFYKLFLQE